MTHSASGQEEQEEEQEPVTNPDCRRAQAIRARSPSLVTGHAVDQDRAVGGVDDPSQEGRGQ